MKVKDIRDLTDKEIIARVKEDDEQLLRLRMNNSVSAIENPSKIRTTRKTIARLKTIVRQRELGIKQ